MKNSGNAKHILGMRITQDRSNGCVYLSPSKYVNFNLESAKPFERTIIDAKLSKDECPKI